MLKKVESSGYNLTTNAFSYFSVGSFVWSHLHNLKVSARPSRMEIQAMLQNTDFSSKFNKAYFKFSRNYESSIYINEYGVGMIIFYN